MTDGVWQWPWPENRHKAVITAWFIKAKAMEETHTPGSQGWLTSRQTGTSRPCGTGYAFTPQSILPFFQSKGVPEFHASTWLLEGGRSYFPTSLAARYGHTCPLR